MGFIPEPIDIKQDLQLDGLPTMEVKLCVPVVTKMVHGAATKYCPEVKY